MDDGSLTAAEIAEFLEGQLDGATAVRFRRVNALATAGPEEVAYYTEAEDERGRGAGEARRAELEASGAGLILAAADVDLGGRAAVRVGHPQLAAALLATRFVGAPGGPPPGVHPSAIVDPTAELGANVAIGPHCTVAAGASIGAGSVLHAGVHLGPGASVGAGCRLHPGVVLYERVSVGDGCTLHAQVILGAPGFGYVWDGSRHVPVPQTGGVVVGAGVEIGPGSTVDAGTFEPTTIGDGAILDDQVMIGHNCRIGRAVVICAQTGLSGSTEVGDGAVLAGQTASAGHLRIGAGATAAGRAGVVSDVPDGETWMGFPARERQQWLRLQAKLRRLARGDS